MNNVLTNLEALASGVGKQDVDTSISFYNIVSNQLETQEEREAFRLGALAIFADVGNMRIRAWYYRRKFQRAMERL